jgi:hypothetical protein
MAVAAMLALLAMAVALAALSTMVFQAAVAQEVIPEMAVWADQTSNTAIRRAWLVLAALVGEVEVILILSLITPITQFTMR